VRNADMQAQHDDEEQDDEFDNYMASALMQEANNMGILQTSMLEQTNVYEEAIVKVQRALEQANEKIDTSMCKHAEHEENFEDELGEQIMRSEANEFVCEYNDVIDRISCVCSALASQTKSFQAAKQPVEREIELLSPRINELATEFKNQTEEVQQRCFLETLLKGSFALLAVKNPKVALLVSSTNLKIFFEVFAIAVELKQPSTIEFKKVFKYMFETVRGLLIYAKEGKFD
jgi:hypothetical protein